MIRFLSPIVLLILLTGCGGRQIVYPGNLEYNQRVGSFKIKPDEANNIAGHPFGEHGPQAVIDRWYLFSKPYKDARVDLAGVYVNGDTGAVEIRHSEKSLESGSFTAMPAKLPDDPWTTTHTKTAIAPFVAPVAAAPVLRSATQPSPQAKSPLEIPALFLRGIESGDVDLIVSLFEPQGMIVPEPNKFVRGPDAIRSMMTELIAKKPKSVVKDIEATTSGDIALVQSHWTITFADGKIMRLRPTLLVRRQPAGHWLVVIDRDSPAE